MATQTEPATSAIFRALRSVDVDPDLAYEAAAKPGRTSSPAIGAKIDSQSARSSSAGESHPHALTEPDVSLSAHPALIVQPLVEAWSNVQRAAGRVERPVQATCGLGEAHGAWIYTSAASTSPRSG